ncbi:MAG TPA: hypothetical protein DEV93_18725 [Chloroflexi bacterium]|nr:hypothetical protein [Chloroflexota bacterium]
MLVIVMVLERQCERLSRSVAYRGRRVLLLVASRVAGGIDGHWLLGESCGRRQLQQIVQHEVMQPLMDRRCRGRVPKGSTGESLLGHDEQGPGSRRRSIPGG